MDSRLEEIEKRLANKELVFFTDIDSAAVVDFYAVANKAAELRRTLSDKLIPKNDLNKG